MFLKHPDHLYEKKDCSGNASGCKQEIVYQSVCQAEVKSDSPFQGIQNPYFFIIQHVDYDVGSHGYGEIRNHCGIQIP